MFSKSVVIAGKPVGRLRASFLLLRESFRFLKADAEMLLIPIVASILNLLLFCLLCAATFFLVWGGSVGNFVEWMKAFESAEATSSSSYSMYAFMFVSYVISAFTLAISQAGIAHIVYVRIHGGNATLGQGLSSAFSHSLSLFIWALITSTVGMVLQVIAERSRIVMRIVVSLLGVAWNVMTYFVVPAMVIDKKSAFGSIGKSVSVFKKTWGETLVSNVSLGAIFMFINLLFIALCIGVVILGATQSFLWLSIAGGVILVVGLFMLALLHSTLNGVLKTLLYAYAAENVVPNNFNKELLEKMIVRQNGVLNSAGGVPITHS